MSKRDVYGDLDYVLDETHESLIIQHIALDAILSLLKKVEYSPHTAKIVRCMRIVERNIDQHLEQEAKDAATGMQSEDETPPIDGEFDTTKPLNLKFQVKFKE